MLLCSVLSVGKQGGFADDYSFLIRGLLDLYEASQVRSTHYLILLCSHQWRWPCDECVATGTAVVGVGVEATGDPEWTVLG